jgi:YMGG-like Gly-zipper
MSTKWAVFLPVLTLLSACTTIPIGPNVMVLPGVGKPFDQFQVDDVLCRQFAQQQVDGIAGGQASSHDTLNSAAISAVVGAGIGAAIGAVAGHPDVGAAVGAGTGLLTGTAAGAESEAASAGTRQYRYDVAYVQCMYAKGNQVPGAMSTPQPGFGPPPPPHAPPPPPAPTSPPPLSGRESSALR